MTKSILAAGLLVLAFGPGCDEAEFTKVVVSGQVTKTLDPASNTASVLIGTATLANLFLETPDPGDSTFWEDDPFPASVTPMAGADVRVNGGTVGQRLPGAYFAVLDLQHLAPYQLVIETPEGESITARGFLPDSFSIAGPAAGDTLHRDSVVAVWTRSDSAETYLVGVTPPDSTAPGWADGTTDTTIAVPAAAFEDTLGNVVPGTYLLSVTAINGDWRKSGLDLLFSGGNLTGDAVGTFGCAVLSRPVAFVVQ